MINKALQNKNLNLLENQHELLILNKLKELSLPFVNGDDLFVDELCSSTKRLPLFINRADLFVDELCSSTKRLPPFVNEDDLFVDELCSSTKRLPLFINRVEPSYRSSDNNIKSEFPVYNITGKMDSITKTKSNNSRLFFKINPLFINRDHPLFINRDHPVSGYCLSTKKIGGYQNQPLTELILKQPYFFSNNPINLLFSIDDFLFEFTPKQPQRRKSSEFQQQLKERKKLDIFYGHLSKKQLKNLLYQSKSSPGYFSANFFSILERRLDVLLYRTGLVKNILTARQLISHKKILVNNQILNIASYQVNPGDIIAIKSNKNKKIHSFKIDKVHNSETINFQAPLSEMIRRKFRKRRSHFTISPNFVYKLQINSGIQNFQNNKKKKTLHNFIRLLLTKVKKRALLLFMNSMNSVNKEQDGLFSKNKYTRVHFSPIKYVDFEIDIKTSIFPFGQTSTFGNYQNIINFHLYRENNWTLLFFKPLLSTQAKAFFYKSIQRLSGDKKPFFQNKYTRFLHLLEKYSDLHASSGLHSRIHKKESVFVSEQSSETKRSPLKNGATIPYKNTNFSGKKDTNKWKNDHGSEKRVGFLSSKKQSNALKSWKRKFSNSCIMQKDYFVKNSSISTPKRIGGFSIFKLKENSLYRNIVYKTLLQMHSDFLYYGCIASFLPSKRKSNKKTINTLLTLKLKKHITKKRSRKQIQRALRFCAIKPMHVEVSYSMSTAIFLYSPQRLSFPYYIDVDLISRSFR
jgi:ribosomal protein S4